VHKEGTVIGVQVLAELGIILRTIQGRLIRRTMRAVNPVDTAKHAMQGAAQVRMEQQRDLQRVLTPHTCSFWPRREADGILKGYVL
jgi:hypothetical protein